MFDYRVERRLEVMGRAISPVLFLLLLASMSSSHSQPPNIVILLVDDLGIGDLGCFGNLSLPTPHIDQLCQTGAVLSHHVTTAVLCTPSRAALITGRYAVRMGLTGPGWELFRETSQPSYAISFSSLVLYG